MGSLPDGLVGRLSILGYFSEHQWRNVLGALPGLSYGGFAWLLEMLQRQTLNPAKILLRDGRRIRPITNESGIGIGRGFS